MDFETFYAKKSAYVYALCFHLEADVEQAERLFTEIWRAAREVPTEVSKEEVDLDVHLCRLTAEFYLKMGGGQRQENWEEEASSILTTLAAEHRLPLVFREIGGLDYAGLSVALTVPEATVRSRLARARSSLRKVRPA